MQIKFSPEADLHFKWWLKSGNKKILAKIAELIQDVILHLFEGIGKPEALKYELAPNWSRRINKEHRMIYHVENDIVYIHSLKGHYQ